jgi:hypothetical protein
LVPKGRFGEGWERFGLKLHLAFRLLHADSASSLKQLGASGVPHMESNTMTRSYADILRSSPPKLEEPLPPFQACPLAKGPGAQLKATIKTTSAKSVSPVLVGPTKAVRAPALVPVSGLRKRAADSSPFSPSPISGKTATRKPATRKSRLGDNLDFRSFRKTLESLLVDIGHCLSVLDQLGEDLLGHGSKQPVFRPKLKNQSRLGSNFFRSKAKGPPPAHVTPVPTSDLKGKAPLVLPNLWPKLVYKAKVGSGPVSSNPGASSSSLVSSSLPVAGYESKSIRPVTSLSRSDGSSLEIPSPSSEPDSDPPQASCALSRPRTPELVLPCLAPVPLVLPPLASLVVLPLARLQHLSPALKAPMAVSLRLQLRSPPLVKDSISPLTTFPLPYGSTGTATPLPDPDSLSLDPTHVEAAPHSHLVAGGLELDFPTVVNPIPLACCPPPKSKWKSRKSSPDWLMPMLEDSWCYVGLSCDGSVLNHLPLFSDMLSKHEDQGKYSSPKVRKKGVRDVNGLFCSVNYDARNGGVSRVRNKRRALSGSS